MTILHNLQAHRFETTVAGGLAFIRYDIRDQQIFLLHVEVPHESRGQGIAAELTRTSLEFAKTRSLKVVAVCPYVSAYLQRHPLEQ
jgi:predicted GNAT family acetyltransferase